MESFSRDRPGEPSELGAPQTLRGRAESREQYAISFGPFRLFPKQRLLLKYDEPLFLGSRAFDVLIALAERPGELVGKKELLARVWPTTTVVEGNLRVQVAALRRALGDGRGGNRYLATVNRRGYCFVAAVEPAEDSSRAPGPSDEEPALR
jgi:DNA-binding winged helix-turn-helix (wHTH) protein